jgi:putative FmdB family regulatory protein
MPIFEYTCAGCSREFEAIVHAGTRPTCPDCGGTRLDKRLSVFAVGGPSARADRAEPARPCGSCGDPRGPGACALD